MTEANKESINSIKRNICEILYIENGETPKV